MNARDTSLELSQLYRATCFAPPLYIAHVARSVNNPKNSKAIQRDVVVVVLYAKVKSRHRLFGEEGWVMG